MQSIGPVEPFQRQNWDTRGGFLSKQIAAKFPVPENIVNTHSSL